MDYEKKYNEALKRFKSFKEKYYTKDTSLGDVIFDKTGEMQKDFNGIFPELRESEDERIRQKLMWLLQQDICPFPEEEVAQMLNYLEKQKNAFENGRQFGIMQEQARQEIEWTDEKQKEQIPYIDFVIKPHRGDDNNPYDMQVSEAQEYAIKRGFGIPFNDGEVYVDERHLTQTIGNILRWADEHPKEQKPNIELIQKSWYMEGYKDHEHNREPMWIVKTGEGGPKYEPNLRYGQMLVEEQKPAEKQDYSGLTDLERAIHRGFLCAGVENVPVTIIKETAKDCLAQIKPSEWNEEDERILYNVIAYVGYAAGERGVKDDDFKEANEWLRNLRSHPSWKPSEEQLLQLRCAISGCSYDIEPLVSLEEQLKKL